MNKPVVLAGLAVAVLCTAFGVYYSQYGYDSWPILPEASRNLRFAAADSIDDIWYQDHATKPPLFPIVLFLLANVGIPPAVAPSLLYVAIIAVVFLSGRAMFGMRTGVLLGLTVALTAAFHTEFCKLKSESLFTLLALLNFAGVIRYVNKPDVRNLAFVILTGSAACLTRYMGIFWFLPLTFVAILWVHGMKWKRGLGAAMVSVFLVILPVSHFMYVTYARTGYLTGTDRFQKQRLNARGKLRQARAFKDTRREQFEFTVSSIVSTITTDLFAPGVPKFENYQPNSYSREASNPFLMRYSQEGRIHTRETDPAFVGAVSRFSDRFATSVATRVFSMIVLLAIIAVPFAGGWKAAVTTREISGLDRISQSYAAAVVYLAVYVLAMLVLWTVSNNDRVSSRFLVPIYPILFYAVAASFHTVLGAVRTDSTRQGLKGALVLMVGAAAWFAVCQLLKLAALVSRF